MTTRHIAFAVLLALASATPAARAQVVVDMPLPPPNAQSSADADEAAASGDVALARYASARQAPRSTVGSYRFPPLGIGLWTGYRSWPYGYWRSPWWGFSPVIINTGHFRGFRHQSYQRSGLRHFGRFRGRATSPSL